MEIRSNEQKTTKIVRYPLASAGRRLASKILDIVLISLIVFGLGCALICTSPGFKPDNLKTIEPWRYTVLSIISLVIFFGYFIILPFFWKKTLFMKALKLQYINNLPLSNFMLNLIKHEILIWGIISIISLIQGIVLGAVNNPEYAEQLIKGIMFGKPGSQGDYTAFFYVGVGFATAYIIAFFGTLAVVIGIFVSNRRPAFHDKFSNVFVIHLVSSNKPDKQLNAKKVNKTRVNYGVPGEISAGALEEIDSL